MVGYNTILTKRYFGTDGIRGRVGVAPITPDFVLRLGWAVGQYLQQAFPAEDKTVVIGKDTRISGYMFESALQAGLVSAGIHVKLLGPMPTPAIAYLTRTQKAKIGIVISASHNPYYDNGIKFFTEAGNKLSDEVELAIESFIDLPMETVSSESIGKVTRIADAAGRYIEYCKSTVGIGFSLKGLKLVLDCAHGATYHIAAGVFQELGADIDVIGASPDGLNINQEVGTTSPQVLQKRVQLTQADFGIAFDGDGDRVIFVSSAGEIIDGDMLLFIIALAEKQCSPKFEGVVGTVMTNLGIENALSKQNIELARADVGDRYVKALMLEKGWSLGGESSGHIICSDVSTTGDGIVSALKVLLALDLLKMSYQSIATMVDWCPQEMVNIPVKDKSAVINSTRLIQAVAKTTEAMADKGRVLVRASGTESLVRVMIEAQPSIDLAQHLKILTEAVKKVADSE